jgi:hypothetical protein
VKGTWSWRNVFEGLVLSHAWLALGGAAQSWWVTSHLSNNEQAWFPVLAAGCGIFAAYGLLRWSRSRFPVAQGGDLVLAWHAARRRSMLRLSLVAAAAAAVLLWSAPLLVWWVVLLMVLPWMLYLLPIRVGAMDIGLRQVPALKLVVIVWCWLLATVALPVAFLAPDHFWMGLLGHGLVQGPLITGIALLFDLRDQAQDAASMRTIPQVIGPRWTRLLVLVLFLYAATIVVSRGLLSYMSYVEGDVPWSEVLAGAGLAFGAVLALRAGPARSWAFYAFGVDGLLVLVPVLAWLGDRL